MESENVWHYLQMHLLYVGAQKHQLLKKSKIKVRSHVNTFCIFSGLLWYNLVLTDFYQGLNDFGK